MLNSVFDCVLTTCESLSLVLLLDVLLSLAHQYFRCSVKKCIKLAINNSLHVSTLTSRSQNAACIR